MGCPYVLDEDSTTISSTSHYIEGLEEYSTYIITVKHIIQIQKVVVRLAALSLQ